MAPVLRNFYALFEPQLREAERTMEKVAVEPEKVGEPCPECGADLLIKLGRFGKFIGCANYPTCRYHAAAGGQDRREVPEGWR